MTVFFKQLFCSHEYELRRLQEKWSFWASFWEYNGGYISVFSCEKCSKTI